MMNTLTKELQFTVRGDERGSLVALESLCEQVPFEIKRVYYIFGTDPEAVRGKHAHHKLKQVLVCVSGACDIRMDDGKERKTVRLDHPAKGLYIEGLIYHEMLNFSRDCVLLVLADAPYDESDYIRDYHQFLKEVHL